MIVLIRVPRGFWSGSLAVGISRPADYATCNAEARAETQFAAYQDRFILASRSSRLRPPLQQRYCSASS
jgi:hypothetical protein